MFLNVGLLLAYMQDKISFNLNVSLAYWKIFYSEHFLLRHNIYLTANMYISISELCNLKTNKTWSFAILVYDEVNCKP